MDSKSPMFPHHRQSTADSVTEPVLGLLAGGPNPGKQDGCKYEFSDPEITYSNSDCSYASNEIAINWNAPIMYLANAIEALKGKVGYVGKQAIDKGQLKQKQKEISEFKKFGISTASAVCPPLRVPPLSGIAHGNLYAKGEIASSGTACPA